MTSDFGAEPKLWAGRNRVRAEALLAAGIDLGAGKSPHGIATIRCDRQICIAERLVTSHGIYKVIQKLPVAPAAIDAPLSPPYRGFRDCEKRALRLGAKLLPGGFKSVKKLSLLGYSLKMLLEEAGALVYETHPTSFARFSAAPAEPPMNCCSTHAWHAAIAAVAAVAASRGDAVIVEGEECSLVLGLKRGTMYELKIEDITVVFEGVATF